MGINLIGGQEVLKADSATIETVSATSTTTATLTATSATIATLNGGAIVTDTAVFTGWSADGQTDWATVTLGTTYDPAVYKILGCHIIGTPSAAIALAVSQSVGGTVTITGSTANGTSAGTVTVAVVFLKIA